MDKKKNYLNDCTQNVSSINYDHTPPPITVFITHIFYLIIYKNSVRFQELVKNKNLQLAN